MSTTTKTKTWTENYLNNNKPFVCEREKRKNSNDFNRTFVNALVILVIPYFLFKADDERNRE